MDLKDKIGWSHRLGIALVFATALLYFIHYLIFHDLHHIFIYMIGDVAFLPIEVLFVSLIIHRLLSEREKRIRLEKLNMVVGAFFSEVGTKMLAYFSDMDPYLEMIQKDLVVQNEWCDGDFTCVKQKLSGYDYSVDMEKIDLKAIRKLLLDNRRFFLRLLENPNLLEHESFTDLLMAVFHLTEELQHREQLKGLPEADVDHITGDIQRVYSRLVMHWLDYMHHLKDNYPFLFSLAMRTNPFDQEASAIITGD